MTKRKPVQAKKATPQPAAARKPAKPRRRLADRLPAWTPYALLFILGWIFCSAIYGPMFERASRMSFFAFDETLMRFLTDKPGGYLLALGRWMLLLFKYPWAGGLLLSLMLTATVALLDYALRLPARWRWTTQLLPAAVLHVQDFHAAVIGQQYGAVLKNLTPQIRYIFAFVAIDS